MTVPRENLPEVTLQQHLESMAGATASRCLRRHLVATRTCRWSSTCASMRPTPGS